MADAVSETVVDPIAIEDADRAHLETTFYEWSEPLDVLDVGAVEWEVPFGDNWLLATVVLETGQGTQYTVKIGPDEAVVYHDDKPKGTVERLEPAEDGPAGKDEVWFCGACGYGPATQRGVKIHHGRSHEGDAEVLSEAPDVILEEEAADGAPEDTGDDVQEEIDDEDEDEPEVALPDGVTVDDVEAAVADRDRLGDVADDLGVTRGRARTITVALGCYGDVQDLPRSDRGQVTLTGAVVFWTICMLFLGFTFAITNGVTVP